MAQALLTPDEVLLRRFGLVRAVGSIAYLIAVIVLWVIYGTAVWPLLVGLPVLLIATAWYFRSSPRAPRATTVGSLLADLVVLAAAAAVVGGTGSGTVLVQTIVIVSAGILLGPVGARLFTGLAVAAALTHLGFEELGLEPLFLHRPDLGDRAVVLAISIGVLLAVGFLTDIYASRLHELIDRAGAEAARVKRRGRRRRRLVRRARDDVRPVLHEVEEAADALAQADAAEERERIAGRLRIAAATLDAEVGRLADLGVLGTEQDARLEPVALEAVVVDALAALGPRLAEHPVTVDVPPLKVVGDRRAARRVALLLLENVVEHTPPGTPARVHAVAWGAHAVLAVTDEGPGIAATQRDELFDPDSATGAHVGLPLVAELCRQMGATCRHEPAPSGGARFLVTFKLAPSSAPSADEDAGPAPSGAARER